MRRPARRPRVPRFTRDSARPRPGATVLVGAVAVLAPACQAAAAQQWVVGVRAAAAVPAVSAELRRQGAPVRRVRGLNAVVTGAAARNDIGDPRVAYIEPVRRRHALAEPAERTDPATGRAYSWALDAVHADRATRPDPALPRPVVAVVDTGVDSGHPDLSGQVLPSVDLVATRHADDVGHGTFVAGVIDALDGNGVGTRGISLARVLPVKISADGSADSVDMADGIRAAVDAGARVLNISFGGDSPTRIEQSAIDYAVQHDVLIVAAAGNEASAGNPLEYPAAAVGGTDGGWSTGLSVGATDEHGMPADFSNHNASVSLSAPGTATQCDSGILSLVPSYPTSIWFGPLDCQRLVGGLGPGAYGYASGTSASAPLVAGAAAEVWAARPQLRADQVADVLRRSADQTVGTGWNEYTGAGQLDLAAALTLARTYDLVPPTVTLRLTSISGGLQATAVASDAASGGAPPAGPVNVTLSDSRDGVTWSTLTTGSNQAGRTVGTQVGQKWWFKAEACDEAHNCATQQGSITAQTVGSSGGGSNSTGSSSARTVAFTVRSVKLVRCGRNACATVTWRGRGTTVTTITVTDRHGHSLVRARRHVTGRARLVLTPGACPATLGLRVRSGARRVLIRRRLTGPVCRTTAR